MKSNCSRCSHKNGNKYDPRILALPSQGPWNLPEEHVLEKKDGRYQNCGSNRGGALFDNVGFDFLRDVLNTFDQVITQDHITNA